ncbi:MAG TPA: hypothetical protein VEA79_03090 [Phenylobacterium sp.]|nr:hypothetical protein [Phenylobacterium sp.]
MQDISEDMVRELFAAQPEPPVLLATLEAEGLDDPIRVTTHPEGLTSRGDAYQFFPFTVAFGGASEGQPIRETQLEIANVDGRIARATRYLIGNPVATIEAVRLAAPDVVEQAMTSARIRDIEFDDPKAIATLLPRDFAGEPACQARYVPSRTPSLF